jgi:hypothetical protein
MKNILNKIKSLAFKDYIPDFKPKKNQLSLEELMKKALAEAPTKESYDTMRASLEQIIKKQKNNKNE